MHIHKLICAMLTSLYLNLPDSDPYLVCACRGQILPSKAASGKPESLVCMYTATGHTNAVLSLDVLDNYMITGSKGVQTCLLFTVVLCSGYLWSHFPCVPSVHSLHALAGPMS